MSYWRVEKNIEEKNAYGKKEKRNANENGKKLYQLKRKKTGNRGDKK